MPPDLNAIDAMKIPGVHNTALLIPCFKSAKIIGPTLVAALKIFPPHHIYVLANGNSPAPLDDTEEICRPYGVNHIWSPVGSKIVAQFVGCYAAKHFENVLLIDDDCALPANFPIVSDRMKGKIQCVGYTIKSVGPHSSRGTLCQQAQDLEYKISGLQRQFAGVIGSATFPHGAISLWNTKFLIQTFHTHPGFSVSEDWFFGHVARELGCRITMCSAIFVETETPTDVFFAARGGSRGGFGEMTVFKQRFYRWSRSQRRTSEICDDADCCDRLLLRQWHVLQPEIHHRELEAGLLGDWCQALCMARGLRDSPVLARAIRAAHLTHCASGFLQLSYSGDLRAVLCQRHGEWQCHGNLRKRADSSRFSTRYISDCETSGSGG